MPTQLDADLADEPWFALPQHQARQYRIRLTGDGSAFIVVRRRPAGPHMPGGVGRSATFLRVLLGPSLPKGVDASSEKAAEQLWWERAWPDADPGLRRSAMRRARSGGAG